MDEHKKIYNRELSWLAFNNRVLQEAQDSSVPLLQRLRFLGIYSNNQDEFIKVRVGNLIRMSKMRNVNQQITTGGYLAKDLLTLIDMGLMKSSKIVNTTYLEILDGMEKEGIFVLDESNINDEQIKFCQDYYADVISSRLVPINVKKTTKLPFLPDNHIYHAVRISTGRMFRYFIIQIPISSACPRFVVLPSSDGKRKEIIFLDDIIRLCLNEIFFMFKYDTICAYTFKILRDAELTLDDDVSKSLISKMEEGLENRLHGKPIRLIYDREMPNDLFNLISTKFRLKTSDELAPGGRYHHMKNLMDFPKVRPDLEVKKPLPENHPSIKPFSSILHVIRHKDILLNYPYHRFENFIDFLREAAIDPKVERIYITLYRTAERSKVINALINAAKNGKQVIVLLELMARFDEEQNVRNTDLLQDAGIKVIHGIEGVKIHSKLVLIERRESSTIKGYVYVGTGNFNESTAKIYADFGYFTYNQVIVNDARVVFDFLQNTHRHFHCKKLLVAPYYMSDEFVRMVENEIRNARKGKEAYVYGKFNSLTDPTMILLLYKASMAGVLIKLIVRGACCLRSGVKGMSENIKIISIVDIYLEHARLFIVCNGGKDSTYIMSADWMPRNLHRRVEVGIPITDKIIKKTLKQVFNIQWSDNVKAREVKDLNTNNYITNDKKPFRSQMELHAFYKGLKNK